MTTVGMDLVGMVSYKILLAASVITFAIGIADSAWLTILIAIAAAIGSGVRLQQIKNG